MFCDMKALSLKCSVLVLVLIYSFVFISICYQSHQCFCEIIFQTIHPIFISQFASHTSFHLHLSFLSCSFAAILTGTSIIPYFIPFTFLCRPFFFPPCVFWPPWKRKWETRERGEVAGQEREPRRNPPERSEGHFYPALGDGLVHRR